MLGWMGREEVKKSVFAVRLVALLLLHMASAEKTVTCSSEEDLGFGMRPVWMRVLRSWGLEF